jgi:hypothetical protein
MYRHHLPKSKSMPEHVFKAPVWGLSVFCTGHRKVQGTPSAECRRARDDLKPHTHWRRSNWLLHVCCSVLVFPDRGSSRPLAVPALDAFMQRNTLLIVIVAAGSAMCWWPKITPPNLDLPGWKTPLILIALVTGLGTALSDEGAVRGARAGISENTIE